MAVDLKRCATCACEKPLTDFFKNANYRDGRLKHCKKCFSERWLIPYKQTAKYKAYCAEYRNRPETKAKMRNREYMSEFGITLKQYNTLLRKQNFRCAICETPQEKTRIRFAVDHSHKVGNVRGLLCDRCNRGLGFFGDDPYKLLIAREYILQNLGGPGGG